MNYAITFLEGIITFISPCLLPMLPIYISYFAVQDSMGGNRSVLTNAFGFVFGFTIIFISMGAFAGTIGGYLREYNELVNIIAGIIIILFGLNFMEFINISFLNTSSQMNIKTEQLGFLSSALFGIVFSITWTPCVGAFLGSALMMAASSGESLKGIFLLLCFSLGLGIPFIASAVLIDNLKSVFGFIKRNYRLINLISGALLIVVGITMISGYWGTWLAKLSF